METKRTILVVGLGSMGFGMADSLLRAGYKVYGADIDPQKTDDLCAKGAIAAENMGEDLADILVSVVLNAPQTETVLFGAPDYAKRLKPDGVIVACATVPPAFAKEAARRSLGEGGPDPAQPQRTTPRLVTKIKILGPPRFRDIPGAPDVGFGTPPLVDLGCYERQP